LLTKHRLSKAEFVSLAGGTGSLEVIASLREAEQSKHLMLVHAIAQHANGADHGTTAFRDGYELLGELQSRGAAAWLLDLPHLGGWAHDCLIALERGAAVDFGHLASIAAAAAVHAGTPFELEVPVRDGRVLLPGLGSFDIPGEMDWIRLRGDGDRRAAEA
jgi:HEXXH motif-containing protein